MEEAANIRQLLSKQIAEGDRAKVQALAESISDSLFYVPVNKTNQKEELGDILVEVITVEMNGTKYVPAFTAKTFFSAWCQSSDVLCTTISLFGADLAETIGVLSIVIDPLSSQECRVDSKVVDFIRTGVVAGSEEVSAETEVVELSSSLEDFVAELQDEVNNEMQNQIEEQVENQEKSAVIDLSEILEGLD